MKKIEVMLIDAHSGRSAILEQALSDAGYRIAVRIVSTDRLLQQVQDTKPDVILIDIDLPDRDTLEQLRDVGQNQPKPIVMFAERSDSLKTTAAALRAGVSAYVVDDLTPRRLKPIMDVAIARFREYQALRRELEETRNQLAERKIIEKAKGLLMAQRNMNEKEAYQALRKLAMDRNQRVGEVARTVVSFTGNVELNRGFLLNLVQAGAAARHDSAKLVSISSAPRAIAQANISNIKD